MKAPQRKTKPVLGWREWLTLPDLGVRAIKAKVDTGARSSALHAFDVEHFERDGRRWVRFKLHPFQKDTLTTVAAEAELHCERYVRNSGGHLSLRPVILTTLELDGKRWPIELTLVRRDAMGFRMLLGRQAVRRRFRVEPGRSYLLSQAPPARPGENSLDLPAADGAAHDPSAPAPNRREDPGNSDEDCHLEPEGVAVFHPAAEGSRRAARPRNARGQLPALLHEHHLAQAGR